MTGYAVYFLVPISGSERPPDQIRPARHRKQGKPLDAAAFTNPVLDLHKVRVDVFCEARSFGVVARDGIEPPTPAFSGLRSTN